MTASFATFLDEDRRLVLLKALESAAGYRLNHFTLHAFAQSLAHVCSQDKIKTDLAWLEEQGLVRVEKVQDVTLATLTARGLDVAVGNTTVPGVKRPAPGA